MYVWNANSKVEKHFLTIWNNLGADDSKSSAPIALFCGEIAVKKRRNREVFRRSENCLGAVYGMQGIQPERLNAEGEAWVLLAGG